MTHERFQKYERKATLRRLNRGSLETTECRWCGKTISNGHIIRYHCNHKCGRKAIYFKNNSLENTKGISLACQESYDLYRNYMIEQIKTQPIMYYKAWEMQARNHTIPVEIMDMVKSNTPLPRPRFEIESNVIGYGLPKIKLVDRVKL